VSKALPSEGTRPVCASQTLLRPGRTFLNDRGKVLLARLKTVCTKPG
jgi:hypothetical protein